jgi:ribosomal protein L31E
MSEKKVIIGIDVKLKNSKYKASYAMKEFRNQIVKHFRNKDCIIDADLNSFFWQAGKKNAPTKVPVVSVEENDKVYLFLEGSEGYKHFKNKGKEETKKDKKKAEKKTTEEKAEAVVEEKVEKKKETIEKPKKATTKTTKKTETKK